MFFTVAFLIGAALKVRAKKCGVNVLAVQLIEQNEADQNGQAKLLPQLIAATAGIGKSRGLSLPLAFSID